MNLDNIPMLDSESENFKDDLAFNIWSMQSCTDFRNDRERPYDGQPWTDQGERGKQEVKGLTMRDICDCLVKGFLLSSVDDEQDVIDYALDKSEREELLSEKVQKNTWRYQDIYKVNLSKVDPGAVINNLSCEIEKMMGIFPNIKKYGDIF